MIVVKEFVLLLNVSGCCKIFLNVELITCCIVIMVPVGCRYSMIDEASENQKPLKICEVTATDA